MALILSGHEASAKRIIDCSFPVRERTHLPELRRQSLDARPVCKSTCDYETHWSLCIYYHTSGTLQLVNRANINGKAENPTFTKMHESTTVRKAEFYLFLLNT